MPEKTQQAVALFQLRAVELHELVIHKPAEGTAPILNFNFDLRIETNIDEQQKFVMGCTHVKIKNETNAVELGSIVCACVFSVANFSEVVTMKNDKQGDLEETFANTLNSICISTTRGVMFSELKGTFLHYAFLPIIDIKSLSKEVTT